jgi:hypothetical protein
MCYNSHREGKNQESANKTQQFEQEAAQWECCCASIAETEKVKNCSQLPGCISYTTNKLFDHESNISEYTTLLVYIISAMF